MVTIQYNYFVRSIETHKGAVRADRKIKELQFTCEEDQKNFERLSDLGEKLQNKTRTYRKQIEDAEEIAALNLAKFRKAQHQLEEVGINCRVTEVVHLLMFRLRIEATRLKTRWED